MVARYWTGMIRAGLAVQEEYRRIAEQVEMFLRPNHDKFYEDDATRVHFMDFRGSAMAAVPKLAQMRNSLGPRLYHAKPVRTVKPQSKDGVMLGLARVLETYLNYTVRETKFVKQLRKSIDDGLVRGRGVLVQTWDDAREVVTSRRHSSLDVVFDPDYTEIEDAKWVAIRHHEPLWETKRRITEKWRTKDLKPIKTSTESTDEFAPKTADQVSYWVVLSKMGAGFRGMRKEGEKSFADDKDFVRLEIVLDHKVPLDEGDWDVPFYLDADWPLSYVDFVEPIDRPHPDSIGGQVVPLQKGIDLLTSLKLAGVKNRERFVLAVDGRLKNETFEVLKSGTAADVLPVDVPSGAGTLDQAIKPLDFGQGCAETALERQFLIDELETTTGVTAALHGGDTAGAKERSATASQQKQGAADARTADLWHKAEEFATDAARKEGLIVRLLLDAEEVEPFVSAEALALYYVHVEVPGGVPLPVRKLEGEGMPISLQEISPAASDYFLDPAAAYEASVQLWAEMQISSDPRVIQLARAIGTELDEQQMPIRIDVAPVDVKRVWQDTAGLSAKELMRELGYEIASGSGQKINKEAEQANADTMIQQLAPILAQMGDIEGLNKVMRIRDEAYDVPFDKRVELRPPPAPQPQPDQKQQQAA